MSENERQSLTKVVPNDKLQGSVATYSRRGGVVNNHTITTTIELLCNSIGSMPRLSSSIVSECVDLYSVRTRNALDALVSREQVRFK